MTFTRPAPVATPVVAQTAAEIVPRILPAATRRRRKIRTTTAHALLIGFALVFMLPLVFVVLGSLMSNDQVLSAQFWPRPFQWSNYPDVWRTIPLWQYGWNTEIGRASCRERVL